MAVVPITARAVAVAAAQAPSTTHPSFGELLRTGARPSHATDRGASPLRTLETVERAQRRLDEILAQARSGRTFTGAELLALQAEAHRFSHTVEIASKVVEQGAQTIKQAVNTPL